LDVPAVEAEAAVATQVVGALAASQAPE
jgi:hypothetical protein